MNNYDARKEWTKAYSQEDRMSYPSEYVIRIFRGSYPKLNLDKKSFKGKKICDVGCGDGRNLVLLHECGFQTHGTEITESIINQIRSNLKKYGIIANLKVGTNYEIPFQDNFFNFALSWFACYYMGKELDFDQHVKELSRILKKNGYLIVSIPKKTAFIYHDSEPLKKNYQIIRNDPFKIRNGEVLRIFEDENEIKQTFSKYFKNFSYASIHDDCFGYDYHFHVFVCQKK